MPRKAPKEVIEHRITLGDYERKELKDAIDAYQRDKVLENIPNVMLGTAGLIAGVAVGFVGYALYYWLDSVPSISDLWDEAKGKVTKSQDFARRAVTGAADNVLANMTREELEAKLEERVTEFDNQHQLDLELINSDSVWQRGPAQARVNTYETRRQELLESNARILSRWESVQADLNS